MTHCIIYVPETFRNDVTLLFTNCKPKIVELIKKELTTFNIFNAGIYFNVEIIMRKLYPDADEILTPLYIQTARYLTHINELNITYDTLSANIIEHFENYFRDLQGSGLVFDKIGEVTFSYHKVTLRNVNTGNIPWPTKRGKNFIFNPSSPCCVVKCICAAVEHKNLLKNNKKIKWYNIERKFSKYKNCCKVINIPEGFVLSHIEDLPILERKNRLSINVYQLTRTQNEDGTFEYAIDLFWKSKKNHKSHYQKINLIIYTENEQTHCYLIKNDFTKFINNFANLQLKKNEILCNHCFQKFSDRLEFVEHKVNLCASLNNDIQMKYPKPGDVRKFRHYGRCEKYRYLQFFDFEALLKDVKNVKTNENEKIHIPISFSQITVDTKNNEILSHNTYLGLDCVDIFLTQSLELWDKIASKTYCLAMSDENVRDFENATMCKLCDIEFGPYVRKVRHHCHYTVSPNYLYALCNNCN